MAENEEQPVVETPVEETPAVETPAVETPAAETPEGPKTAAEAIEAGLEAVPQRTKQEADKAAGKVEGEKGGGAGEDEKKGKAGEDAEAAKAKAAEDEKGKTEPDHVNDPIPKELKEATQERIRSLISYVKERDEALTVQGNLISAIQGTGTTAEEFASMIHYLDAFHSEDPKKLELALTILQQNMESIALRLGRDVPGVDFLAGHQDLKDAVKYGQITQQHASEIARARTAQARTQAMNTERQTATQAAQAAEKEKADAITNLNELGAQLAKTDPDYQKKYDLIVGPLKEAFVHIPPSQWRAAFDKAYAAVKLPAVAAPVAAEPPAGMVRDPNTGQFVKANKGKPIRPVQPSGAGGPSAPKSAREALDAAINSLR
jgi:hypothetical protein